MINREHDLPITQQAQVLRISRGSVYYLTRPMPEADLAIMRRLDRLHLEFPFAGSRMLQGLLVPAGCKIRPETAARGVQMSVGALELFMPIGLRGRCPPIGANWRANCVPTGANRLRCQRANPLT